MHYNAHIEQCDQERINYNDNFPLMQVQKVETRQPSLDVSKIELSERLQRIRNPSNLALLANFPRDNAPKGTTLNAVLDYMAMTGKRFDEASRNLTTRLTTFQATYAR